MPVKAFVNLIEIFSDAREKHFQLTPAEGGRWRTDSLSDLCSQLSYDIQRQIVFLGMQKGIRITVSVDEK